MATNFSFQEPCADGSDDSGTLDAAPVAAGVHIGGWLTDSEVQIDWCERPDSIPTGAASEPSRPIGVLIPGRPFRTAIGLHLSPDNRYIRQGDQLDLLVDPAKPERALLRQLYF